MFRKPTFAEPSPVSARRPACLCGCRDESLDKHPARGYASFSMTLSRYRLRQVARLVLALLLFTQGALAASGCVMPGASMVKAVAAGNCPDREKRSGMNLNLCLAHCGADQQSLHTAELPALASPPAVFLVVPAAPPAQSFAPTVFDIERSGDPPIPIRFCSLRN